MYAYDGNGRRVVKTSSSGAQTVYVYDAGGELVSEYSIGTSAPPCTTCYLSLDHLGSTRLVTDQSGNTVSRHDYLPFGEEIAANTGGRNSTFGAQDFVNQKFTAKERDQETGLDYFGARYMSSVQGRWTSPDLLNLTEDRLLNPTNTLNKYAYAGNNPLKFIDTDGLDITLFFKPVANTFDPNDWGHTFLGAYNQQSGEVQFLDFYPSGNLSGFPPSGPGTLNDGTMAERVDKFASITIQTTPELTQKVIDLIKDLKANPQKYSFPNNTCTTLCKTALKLAGIDTGIGTLSPQGLWNSLLRRYSPTYRQYMFDGKSFMPNLTFQAGHDYGQPRQGGELDWQRFLFQLWVNQRPKQACVEAGGEKTCSAY
jgi:RHS repeat-associated protein